MNLIGKTLANRYEIIEKIGYGGMATVYKAKCHVLNRYVAVKVLKDEFTTDSEFIKKFNTEAQAVASLTHPNIVSIYDVGNEDNLYYIVMEYIQGKTLKEIITEEGKLSWKWSVNIAMQIASALETAHKNNIIHRDIKPHNIIITEDGMAKVTDFGIAKAVSNSTMTAFGTTIGSVHYFSPEHAKGGLTDAKSDLYSLGVVMYEMVTGRVPFDADTPVSVALKQVQEEPVDPMTYNKDLPISVDKIILKAMQKNPNYRYQNATEMIKDLNRALKNPDEDFVTINDGSNDSPTQKVPTLYDLDEDDDEDDDEDEEDGNDKDGKKKGKFRQFLSKHKFIRFLFIALILVIVFVVAALIAMFAINRSRPEQSYLPQVVFENAEDMLTEEEAIELLNEAGFTNITVVREPSEEVEAGYVIKIDPDKLDFLYNLDVEITLTVSSGPEIVTLPSSIVGEYIDDIRLELEKLGLALNVTEETSETIESGIIISVDPQEGTEITKSTVVNLVVSSGSKYKDITIVNVVGQTESNARTMLSALSSSLKITVNYEEDDSKDDGIVTKQSIAAGNTIKENEEIVLTVNKKPVKSKVTFDINVASYMGNLTDDEGNPTVRNVTVEVLVAGVRIENGSTSSSSTSYICSYNKVSGSNKVQVLIDGTEMWVDTVDFSAGDRTITISK